MILFFIMVIPLTAVFVWLYLRFCPKGTTLKTRLRFEIPVLIVELLACTGAGIYSYLTVGRGPDRAWWPVIGLIHSSLLFPSILVLAASIRSAIYSHLPRALPDEAPEHPSDP